MIGAIIGDIVGSRFEFDNTNDFNFELFTEDCAYTDDTICTIAVADAAMNGSSYGVSLHSWCRRYPEPMGGYGCSFANWIASNNPQPYNSFGKLLDQLRDNGGKLGYKLPEDMHLFGKPIIKRYSPF